MSGTDQRHCKTLYDIGTHAVRDVELQNFEEIFVHVFWGEASP
jgi:hypothetical protein